MNAIQVTHHPHQSDLEAMGVFSWPIWQKETSEFPWHYDEPETCYFLAGAVTVTPDDGEPISIGQGDLVRFPAGMSCTWRIDTAVRKHYSFG
ncbi:cupin domain-containing protein [Leptolyngbya cf. ectocarpi LEGE 11479]|uniref:Cupin domain-containing protein n=1 Tax=Leptolyngbya cf. ectocarpi LEGE 11479 TaxID=1828722 RepID=A0A928ZSG3_LEPEC|nr:cupin domain-containing protein [Leptolyngbya ectocarpi]MBE9065126.1 cupin domain-containing protein [Leptolyngbya cf. ectocarpi LEGE 11479]